MGKPGFTHGPPGLYTARNANFYALAQFLRGFSAVFAQYLRNGMGKSKGLSVRPKSKLGNLRNAFVSLPQKVIF